MNSDGAETLQSEIVAALSARAVRLLARREHSRAELRQKLRLKHRNEAPLSDELLDAVLDKLVEDGYQSDKRFAELLVRQRVANGYGELDIAARLQKKGVDKTLSADVLREFVSENQIDWYAQAAEALIKRSAKLQRVSSVDAEDCNALDQRMRNRLIRFLQQRGYTHDQVICALEHLVAVSAEPEE